MSYACPVQFERLLVLGAPGSESTLAGFTLRVADIATRVISDDRLLALAVSDVSSRFLVSDGEPPDVSIRVQRASHLSHPAADKLFDSGAVWRLFRDGDDRVFSFVSTAAGPEPYQIARFNASFTTGAILVNDACALQHGEPFRPLEFPLDELLMINLLARGRGVEVHGCGVIDRDGSAYLFAGQSEAGKTTSARLWHAAGATVLSDDRVILRLGEGCVSMYGTPWHGEGGFASALSARLTRIFLLEHGSENAAHPARGATAAARLFACSFPPFHDEAGLDFTLALLADIVDRVPACTLAFVPDAKVVSFVRACQ
ncbi:MAG TPA: hypothetical protein VGZ27_15410 [Vicinamibacterales bacterium]|jgi:hypothetical protein|nr:hypothetical protein [Vicinamibacterales bacterium]